MVWEGIGGETSSLFVLTHGQQMQLQFSPDFFLSMKSEILGVSAPNHPCSQLSLLFPVRHCSSVDELFHCFFPAAI